MGKARMGSLIVVDNTNPHPNASSSYMAVWVEDEDGGNERCLMFRKREVDRFPAFSFPKSMGIEGRMKAGRLYCLTTGTVRFYVVKILIGKDEMVVKLTDKKIALAERLAGSNSEDIPARGALRNLVD